MNAGPEKSRCIEGVEWARVVSCVAIIAFHLQLPGKPVFLGGLHVFTAIMVALSVGSARRHSVRAFAKTRLRTLGVPWLFWCAFYALVGYFDRHTPPLAWAHGSSLLVGPKIHLWFLPFAIIVGLVIAPIAKLVRGDRAWLFWAVLVFPAMIVAATALRAHIAAPFDQWLSVLPSVALGLSLAELPAAFDEIALARVAVQLAGWVLVSASLAILGYAGECVPLLVGGLVTVVAWCIAAAGGRGVMAWSKLSLGVYLVHPFVIRVTYKLVATSAWLHFAVVVLLSFGCAWVLKRTPVLSRFV